MLHHIIMSFYRSIKSEERLVTCGVPPGSVLGPLLFLLYINDFSNSATNIDFHIFADDSNLFCSHKNLQSLEQNLNHPWEVLIFVLCHLRVQRTFVMLARLQSQNLHSQSPSCVLERIVCLYEPSI